MVGTYWSWWCGVWYLLVSVVWYGVSTGLGDVVWGIYWSWWCRVGYLLVSVVWCGVPTGLGGVVLGVAGQVVDVHLHAASRCVLQQAVDVLPGQRQGQTLATPARRLLVQDGR